MRRVFPESNGFLFFEYTLTKAEIQKTFKPHAVKTEISLKNLHDCLCTAERIAIWKKTDT